MRLSHHTTPHTVFFGPKARRGVRPGPLRRLSEWQEAQKSRSDPRKPSLAKKAAALLAFTLEWIFTWPLWIRLGCVALTLGLVAALIFMPRAPQPEEAPSAQPAMLDEQAAQIELPVITIAPTPTETPDITLKQGEDSDRVRDLQTRLMELRYLDLDEPTAHFGPATNYAVQLFQRQHELQIDGIAGAQTQEMIFGEAAKPYTLSEGARGSDVDGFQRRLKQLGYLKTVDGQYGKDTVKAVQEFQKRNGLKVDGKAGEQTFDMIYSSNAKGPVPTAYGTGGSVDKLIAAAKAALGKRYVLGSEGPNSYDCSGLVYHCLVKAGVKTGRLNAAGFSQVDKWKKISYSAIKRGDLLFFSTNGKRVGHTGIYLGGGEMIDASSSNGKVVRRSINTAFWKRNFVNARRPW